MLVSSIPRLARVVLRSMLRRRSVLPSQCRPSASNHELPGRSLRDARPTFVGRNVVPFVVVAARVTSGV